MKCKILCNYINPEKITSPEVSPPKKPLEKKISPGIITKFYGIVNPQFPSSKGYCCFLERQIPATSSVRSTFTHTHTHESCLVTLRGEGVWGSPIVVMFKRVSHFRVNVPLKEVSPFWRCYKSKCTVICSLTRSLTKVG